MPFLLTEPELLASENIIFCWFDKKLLKFDNFEIWNQLKLVLKFVLRLQNF